MKKKPSTAKQRPAKKAARREIINDPDVPLLKGVELLDPPPFKPWSRARLRAERQAREKLRTEARARLAARDADDKARLAGRPSPMRDTRYRLPESVADWLRLMVWKAWSLPHYATRNYGADSIIESNGVDDALLSAFMEGCRQGFIEDVVSRGKPDQKQSATGNAGKRKATVAVGKVTMTRDERDALMVIFSDQYRAVSEESRSGGLTSTNSAIRI